jgi:zinc transport system permease protein
MRVTGALMVDAVTILPALVARRLGKTFSGMLLWGAAAGLSMNLIGFASSVAFDLPVSPAIIVLGAGLVGAVSGVSWLSRRQKDTKYQQPC